MLEFLKEGAEVFILVYVILFVTSLIRAQFDISKIKPGYGLALLAGSVTPFCFCAAIPLFIAFVDAGIPMAIAMTFLLASALINETALALLFLHKAWVSAAVYIAVGAGVAIAFGHLFGRFKIVPAAQGCTCPKCSKSGSKFQYALRYTHKTLLKIGPYILVGFLFGELMPKELIIKYLNVVTAAVSGIFIYSDHGSILPVVQALLEKGVPLGTAMVLIMSTTAISLPKIIVLGKMLGAKLTTLFVLSLFIAFILIGYIL